MYRVLIALLLTGVSLFSTPSLAQRGVFMTLDEMRQGSFEGVDLPWQTLWVTKELRQQIEVILGHRWQGMRIRYLGHEGRTLWKFEEIGKEELITFGVLVNDGRIEQIQVLEYRESRGGEIRYPFFLKQFQGLALMDDNPAHLSGHIDGITGATLSVRAMTKIATLALYCHQQTPFANREYTARSH